MCGIAGIWSKNPQTVSETDLERMNRRQRHRGPDDSGTWILDTDTHRIGLAHCRLSIIDLSNAGSQPMIDPETGCVLVFNGEIYNYIELKETLSQKGYRFNSQTDTEVILKAYDMWGLDCVSHFNGMWAFALYDPKRESLFLSRDRFGIKPLYLLRLKDTLAFASEPKALLDIFPSAAEPDYRTLYNLLVHGRFNQGQDTCFHDIKQLQAAHNLVKKYDGTENIQKYWDLSEQPGTVDDPISTFQDIFHDSVRLRLLRSDVPTGSCLSGGVDSASIVGIASTLSENHLKTFSILYPEDKDCDESPYVRLMEESFPIHSHPIYCPEDHFLETLDHITYHQDEPTNAYGLYSQWFVMKTARDAGVKVLLDGQGGDEVLGGYHFFYKSYFQNLLNQALHEDTETSWNRFHQQRKAVAEEKKIPVSEWLRNDFAPRPSDDAFLSNDMLEKIPLKDHGGYPRKFESLLHDHLYQSMTKTNLPALLHFEDRNSMAFSIEARTPFLDVRLVETAFAISEDWKILGTETKRILRHAMRDILPEPIINRSDKMGYNTPMGRWFRNGWKDTVEEILSPERISRLGLLNPEKTTSMWHEHLSGFKDHTWQIWHWITLDRWFEIFIENRITAAP